MKICKPHRARAPKALNFWSVAVAVASPSLWTVTGICLGQRCYLKIRQGAAAAAQQRSNKRIRVGGCVEEGSGGGGGRLTNCNKNFY